MLNEITFQRKKEFSSYTQPIQSDQSKTIYDFVLKQDTQIKSLEKEILNLKNDILLLSSKVPLLESKSNDQITKTDLNILLPTIPTKEEIKSMIKIELEKSKEKEEIQREIDIIKKENETTKKEITSINTKVNNLEAKLKEKDKEDNTNVIVDQVNKAIGGIEKKTFTITSQLKQNIEEYIIKTNKKLSDIDNDFDRLIDSLKTQFQSVNETILQFDKTKLDIKDISKYISEPRASTPLTYHSNTQSNLFDNFRFHTIEPSTTKSQKISNLSATIFDQFDTNIRNANSTVINSNQMKQDLIALKHDIISDFEKINNKILNELQNQANDIKTLYSELHQNELTDGDSMKLSSLIYQLDSEVNKKANIEQLNYALEAQAKINDAFCSANKLARWSWGDDGLVNENGIIIWTIQNINTSLDVFSWENDSETIYVNVKGIYRISAGVVFSDKKRKIYININNETLMISKDDIPNDESSLIYVEKYFALGDETKIQVGVIMDKKKEEEIKLNINGECNAEGFLEIKKVI